MYTWVIRSSNPGVKAPLCVFILPFLAKTHTHERHGNDENRDLITFADDSAMFFYLFICVPISLLSNNDTDRGEPRFVFLGWAFVLRCTGYVLGLRPRFV